MKRSKGSRGLLVIVFAVIASLPAGMAHAQGALDPTNAPAPSMKTLQQIWDKIAAQQADIDRLRYQNEAILNLLGPSLPWQVAAIYTNGDTGTGPSLAYGPDGQPAIAFGESYVGATDRLYYTRFNGNAWTTSLADATADSSIFASLAFSPAGQPYISHVLSTAQVLRVTSFNGTSWTNTTVDSGADFGFTSMAFGPGGHPAVGYMDGTAGNLKYAHFTGSVWTSEVVDAAAVYLQGLVSLAFGPDGQPALSYYDQGSTSLKFAQFNGSTWDIATVAAPDAGRGADLAFSRAGQPVISYWDAGADTLNLAEFDGVSWSSTVIDTGVGTINSPITSVSHNISGRPVIGYWQSTTSDLKFAEFDGTTWQVSTLDSLGIVGFFVSLAVSPGGEVAIAYTDGNNADLKFARRGLPALP